MFDFHRLAPKMVWLRLVRISNESIENENKLRVALAVELSIDQ